MISVMQNCRVGTRDCPLHFCKRGMVFTALRDAKRKSYVALLPNYWVFQEQHLGTQIARMLGML